MVVSMDMCVLFAISTLTQAVFSIPSASAIVAFHSDPWLVMPSPVSPERKNRIFSIRTRLSEMAFLFPTASSLPI